MSDIKEYTVSVPDEKIDLLKKKLELATFPDELSDSDWNLGTPLSEVKRLTKYWKDEYDWRKTEASLNRLPNYITPVDVDGFGTINAHFIHIKCKVPGVQAIPFLFVHGWPGSYLEVVKLIPLMTEGNGPYFDIVAPSLAGYAWSEGAKKIGFSPVKQAEMCHKIMLKLGYDKYVTQGGDWGSFVTRFMANTYGPKHVVASHFNYISSLTPPKLTHSPIQWLRHNTAPYTEDEKQRLKRGEWFQAEGYGYNMEQSTKPQTLGYALTDSPTGLLAWILEKLHDWTDNYQWTDEEIITWVSIYQFSVAGPTGAHRLYYMSKHMSKENIDLFLKSADNSVKLGVSIFPQDIRGTPLSWARTIGNLVFEKVHPKGGHFAAHELPAVLARDMKEMYGKGGPAYGVVPGKSGYPAGASRL